MMEAKAISIQQELKRKVYVLAVDDQPKNLLSLEQLLNSDDLEVISATSGAEALKTILKFEFACILLDIRMPDMDGFEFAHIIRSDQVFAQIPIIFVTAEAKDQEALFQGYSTGAVDFLVKPLSPIVLNAKVGVFADLFRQKKALDKSKLIEQLYRQLKDSNEQLKQYTHIASHDMREPLRRIHCLVDLLRAEPEVDQGSALRDICDDLGTCTKEMLHLVDDFRELTYIVNAPYELSDVDAPSVIAGIIAEFAPSIEARGINVEVSEFPRMRCNRGLFADLIRSLFENALIHSGNASIVIRIFAERLDQEWVYGVYNSGSSVDPNKVDAIFQPFTRLMAHKKWQHLGLGLTKAKKIVEYHQGRIWVESTADSVCFRFTLAGRKYD